MKILAKKTCRWILGLFSPDFSLTGLEISPAEIDEQLTFGRGSVRGSTPESIVVDFEDRPLPAPDAERGQRLVSLEEPFGRKLAVSEARRQ